MSKPKYKAHTIGSAIFANGTEFRIDQIKANGACRVVDLSTNKARNFTHSITAAWRSVYFAATINSRTERTTECLTPLVRGDYRV